jgi:hypothetical protein
MPAPRPSTFKRALIAAGAALVVGGAAVGVAVAQTATPSPTSPSAQATPTRPPQGTPGTNSQRPGAQRLQQYLDALARRLGVTTDRLRQAMDEARAEVGVPTPGPGRSGRPGGPGGPGAPGRPGGPGFRGFGRASFDVAAQTIGVTPQQLRQELAGKSLADVARAHNVDPARVTQALRDDANKHIDEAAAAGRIPADRVASLKERTSQGIDRFVNQTLPAPGTRPARPTPSPRPS